MSIQKVLLVDDDPRIRKIAQISLEGVGGWKVSLVASGFEAIEVAKKEKPDVILLDVMMPEMDGPTTLSKIREHEEISEIPVIFFTAKVQKQELDSYLALGAAGIISKPFDPMKLPGEIREIVEKHSSN